MRQGLIKMLSRIFPDLYGMLVYREIIDTQIFRQVVYRNAEFIFFHFIITFLEPLISSCF